MKKTAIVTGASSGIGAAAAEKIAGEGYFVVLAARRLERLKTVADRIHSMGGEALPVKTDLQDPDQIRTLVNRTMEATGRVDVLVNNAGFGRLIWFDEQELEKDIAAQIQVNLTGAIQLTGMILPILLEQDRGQIIWISSVSSFVGVPTYSIYTAAKFGMRGFAESLRRELRGTGVQVSSIYLGGVDTEFDQHTGVHWKITGVTPGWLLLSPGEVAEKILRVIKTGRQKVVFPWMMNIAIWGNILFPGLVGWLLSRRFYRKDGKTVAWNTKEGD